MRSMRLYSLFEAHEPVGVTSVRYYGDVDALGCDEHVRDDLLHERDDLQPILVPDRTGSVQDERDVSFSGAR